jgi:hypothetical protein
VFDVPHRPGFHPFDKKAGSCNGGRKRLLDAHVRKT